MSVVSSERNLVIFDVDGTLVDSHPVDNDSFDCAFTKCTGKKLTAETWSKFEEVTAKAIVHQALGGNSADSEKMEASICEGYLNGLQVHHYGNRESIRPSAGALEMLAALQANRAYGVAIATGCWRETALFKLDVAGFDIREIPFACASDRYRRDEIIALAAERAEIPIARAVYVGDGVWDLKASKKLGIPFIGVGRRIDLLRDAGAEHVLEDWSELEGVLCKIFEDRS